MPNPDRRARATDSKRSPVRDLAKKDVKGMMDPGEVGYKEAEESGVFVVPGFAKFVVVAKSPPPRSASAAIPSTANR